MISLSSGFSDRAERPRRLEEPCTTRRAIFDRATPSVSQTAVIGNCLVAATAAAAAFFESVATSQSGTYDLADLEDRHEKRLRAMIEARLQGNGLTAETDRPPVRVSNVIDLMAALKKSLMGEPQAEPEKPKRAPPRKEPERRQRLQAAHRRWQVKGSGDALEASPTPSRAARPARQRPQASVVGTVCDRPPLFSLQRHLIGCQLRPAA